MASGRSEVKTSASPKKEWLTLMSPSLSHAITTNPRVAKPTQMAFLPDIFSPRISHDMIAIIAGKALVIMPATLASVYCKPHNIRKLKSTPADNA